MGSNIVWFRIPKCAGTSIQMALEKEGLYVARSRPLPGQVLGVRPEFDWKEDADRDREFWDSSWKFAVVRNPWDRFISACAFVHRREFLKQKTFREIAFDLPTERNSHPELHITRTLSDIIVDENGELRVDHIIRIEKFWVGWDEVEKRVGIRMPVDHLNQTPHKPYWEYFGNDIEWIERVGEIYKEDIKRFNYAYDDYKHR